MNQKSIPARLRATIIFCSVLYGACCAENPSAKISSIQQLNVNIENKNNGITYGMYEGDCTRLSGKHLIECMACLDSRQLKENFLKLNTRAALYFWHGLKTKQEKIEFLSHISDEQWRTRWQELPPQMRKNISPNRQELLKSLEENTPTQVGWIALCFGLKTVVVYFTGPFGIFL